MIYFVPEAAEAYARLGVTGRAGYFASRAAPMGAVSAEVVVSTFFNFNPELVHAAIPEAWEVTTPEALVAARFDAVDARLPPPAGRRSGRRPTRWSGPPSWPAPPPRRPARRMEGRPLAAGHADVAWPAVPHLVLWHAQSILREYRGDGHIAQLVARGLSGIEALVTHAAAGDVPEGILRSTRGWPQDDWDGAVEALRARGWLEQGDELRFTDVGAAQRRAVEDGTDALAAAPYALLGEERCEELRALARPWSTTLARQLP